VRSADDSALALFAELNLTNVRLAEWTEMGRKFLAENMGEWDAWQERIIAEAGRTRKIAATFIDWTNHLAIGVFSLLFLFMYLWIVQFKLPH